MSAIAQAILIAASNLIPLASQAQAQPCSLLSSAEAAKYVSRGQKTYSEPEVTLVGGGNGSLCQYEHGQIGIWRAPNAQQNLEAFFKAWKLDTGPRTPLSEVGDRAWIMFPVPADKYKDRAAYLIAHVGQQVVTVALFARDGQADGMMGDVCRGDQSRLKPKEKEDCKRVLADKSETQESLQPALIELSKLVVERVKAGKGS